MKKTIKNIIIHILFLIFGFILASCSMDRLITQDLAICGNLGAKSSEITAVQGTAPSGNVFSSLRSFLLFNTTDGWNRVYNYLSTDSLEYTYEGVQPINVDESIDFASGSKKYALDVSFNTPVLLNNQRSFSVLFGALGSLMDIDAVQVGTDDYNVENTDYSFGEVSDYNYLLYFGFNGYLQVKFIRIYFTANFTSQPIYNQFLKLYMYGLYNSAGGYIAGYDDGYNIGYDEGYNEAIIANDTIYNNGYNAGYDQAISEGISSPEHIFYTIWSILTTCGDLLYDFFTIPVFGDVSLGFILIIIPFGFTLIENVIKIIVKLVTMFLGG